MAVTRFEGKLFTDADVVFPSMKDYYYNSLEPILGSYNLKNNEFKYMEDPIGGEDAVGFVTENMDVFSIRCSKDAFDLSEEAQNTGATTAESFLFYPKHESVSVGASVESQKYIDKLLGSESPIRYNKIFNFPLYGIEQIQLQLDEMDEGLNSEYNGEAIILPNTIHPTVDDYFIIDYLEKKYMFRVIKYDYDTIKSNNFYRV